MNSEILKQRTKKFGLNVIYLYDNLPRRKRSTDILAKQLIRSATSVGANYRSACKARSKLDYISKINIVEEEADESIYRLELLAEIDSANNKIIPKLGNEAKELTAIFTATGRTAKLNNKKTNPKSAIRNPRFEIRNPQS